MRFEEFKQQPSEKNYYEILGVSADATLEEIKKAHRKIVKDTHPDLVGDESKREEFSAANEAYSVLSDENKRAQYDHNNLTEKKEDKKESKSSDEDKDMAEFLNSMKDDKEMNFILTLSKGIPGMEEHIQEYLQSAFKLYKDKKKYEKQLRELQRKQDGLKSDGRNFQPRPNYSRTHERKNIRNLVENLGVEKDILGNERLVDTETGQRIGHDSFKSIKYVSGVIIATDILDNKRILSRRGDNSHNTFKDIEIRDGLVIGRDIIGNERLIDKNTGKTIGHGSYKKIIKEGDRIYGINIIGRKEEINL